MLADMLAASAVDKNWTLKFARCKRCSDIDLGAPMLLEGITVLDLTRVVAGPA